MTQQNPLQARHAAAAARVKAAADSLEHRRQDVTRCEAGLASLTAAVEADPKDAPANFAHGQATGDLRRATFQAAEAQKKLTAAQQELAEVERLLGGDDALQRAREVWRAASAAQVQATKAAQAARDELARLDALLADAEAKTATAQTAQRTSILAQLGFTKQPAGEVAEAEGVLLGAAATADALRTARPEIEKKVAEAEAAMAARDKDTRRAVGEILKAKQAIAERTAQFALAECRAAVLAHHAAAMAAGHLFEPLTLYDRSEGEGWFEREAEKLKARAFCGE